MLQEGLHKSFAEIMNLMKRQQEARAKAGPDSALWMQPLLEDEPRKLDQLRAYLTQAEFAQRRGEGRRDRRTVIQTQGKK